MLNSGRIVLQAYHSSVPQSAVTPNNTGGGIHFDATPDVFDVDVLNEYLEWKGQRGGETLGSNWMIVSIIGFCRPARHHGQYHRPVGFETLSVG
jgi:hypothetical protein